MIMKSPFGIVVCAAILLTVPASAQFLNKLKQKVEKSADQAVDKSLGINQPNQNQNQNNNKSTHIQHN